MELLICIRSGFGNDTLIVGAGVGVGHVQQKLFLIFAGSDLKSHAAAPGMDTHGHGDLRQAGRGSQNGAVGSEGLLPEGRRISAVFVGDGIQRCGDIAGEHHGADIVGIQHGIKRIVKCLLFVGIVGIHGGRGKFENIGHGNGDDLGTAGLQLLQNDFKGGGDFIVPNRLGAATLTGDRVSQLVQHANTQTLERIGIEVFCVMVLTVGKYIQHDGLVIYGACDGTGNISGFVERRDAIGGNESVGATQADATGKGSWQTQGRIGVGADGCGSEIQRSGHGTATGRTGSGHLQVIGVFGFAQDLAETVPTALGIGAHIGFSQDHSALLQQIGDDGGVTVGNLVVGFLVAVGGMVTSQVNIVLNDDGDTEENAGGGAVGQSLVSLACYLQCIVAKGDEAFIWAVIGLDPL